MAEVREMIRGLGTGGRTVLLSSHLLHEVEQVCDSVAILSKGRLISQGKVARVDHVGHRLQPEHSLSGVELLPLLQPYVSRSEALSCLVN